MVCNRHGFGLSRPRRHGGDDEAQRLLPEVTELKVSALRDRKTYARAHGNFILLLPVFPPNLAPALDAIPDFFDGSVNHGK